MNKENRKNTASIFSQMTQLANEHGAINLAQGFPNMPIDAALRRCVEEAFRSENHQYSPYQGSINLRQAITQLIYRNTGEDCPPQQILITAGATQAIFTSIQALVTRGDEVILLDPCYDCYELPVTLVGANPVHVPLNSEYLPDWERIEKAITPKTRLIIINSPHNPSGRVWKEKEYLALGTLVEKYEQLLVLSDEVYEYLAFDVAHQSVRNFEKLKHRSVVISSFGKSLQATGWKMGYVTASEELLNPILKVHQYLVFSVNSFLQEGIANYLESFDAQEVKGMYLAKRNLFSEGLASSKFEALPCEGTYFQTVSFQQISPQNDVEFARWLTIKAGVAAIPVSVFNKDQKDRKHVRFCFAKTDKTLFEALERICNL
jgi:methionine aminotransferase